jgi:hypothetical protein
MNFKFWGSNLKMLKNMANIWFFTFFDFINLFSTNITQNFIFRQSTTSARKKKMFPLHPVES